MAYLIQSGADVDVADSDGKTSLYMACQLPGCLNFTCLESPNLSLLPIPMERHDIVDVFVNQPVDSEEDIPNILNGPVDVLH